MKSISVLSLFVILFVLCACAPSPALPTSAASTSSPKRGGTLTMVAWQEPEHLNLELNVQVILNHVYDLFGETLVQVNEKGEWFPKLAIEVPTVTNGGISADGKTITYKLKPGVKWHNGQEFACADLQFSLRVIRTANNGALDAGALSSLDTVDCPNPTTAVLKFKEFYAAWLRVFNGVGIIFPQDIGKPEDLKTWAYNRMPIGTGPFKVTEFVTGDHITLVRNENYWQTGKPDLDKIIVRFVPSSEVAKQMLKNGEADVMWNNTEADLTEIAKMSNVTLFSAPQAGGERMFLNSVMPGDPSDNKTPHPILGDARVRQAIAYGIDKQTIIDQLLNGKALPGTSDLNVDPFNCVNIKPYPYDPSKSKQLLQDAGWQIGTDGIRVKNGVRMRLKFSTTTGNKLREDSQTLILENMKAIGIEFYIENLPSSVLLGSWAANSPRKKGNFDIFMSTTNAAIDPHSQMYNYFDSKMIPAADNQGGMNYGRWADPQTDQWIEQAGTTPDWAQRLKLYCQAAQRAVDGATQIYLYQRFNLHSFNTRVQGWIATPWLGPLWNAADVWIK